MDAESGEMFPRNCCPFAGTMLLSAPHFTRIKVLFACVFSREKVSAAMATIGAGEVIWGVVRLIRHRKKEKDGQDQGRKL